jgi:hypothetical protein
MKKLLHPLFRLLFGVTLLFLGLHGLMNLNKVSSSAEANIQKLHKLDIPQIKTITALMKEHSAHLLQAHYGLFILAGLLSIFGLHLSCFFMFLAVILNLALINNYYFNRDEGTKLHSFIMIALLGATMNI